MSIHRHQHAWTRGPTQAQEEDHDMRRRCECGARERPAQKMAEDDMLVGITDALTLGGWCWHHIRRSDLALQQGQSGWPDIFALHPERGEVFVAELKAATGTVDPLQASWLDAFAACGISARVLRPDAYDETYQWLVGDRLLRRD